VAIRQVFFDLNGTLLDPAAMGAPLDGERYGGVAEAILGDAVLLAMAETLCGSYRDFSELLRAAARRRLELIGEGDRLGAVVSAAKEMEPFPDAAPAIYTLHSAGIGTGVLTNSSSETARTLIRDAALPELDPVVGTDEVRAFKPDRRVYRRAVEAAGLDSAEVALISAHSWDALGAQRAGLRAAWVARGEKVPLRVGGVPDYEAPDLATAAAQLAA
jgi:2-haloacid dehalogenase